MVPLKASKICIVEGIEEIDVLRQRARRLECGIKADSIEHVDDAGLHQIATENRLNSSTRHGMNPDFEPIVIFNKFRFDEPPETTPLPPFVKGEATTPKVRLLWCLQ